jgi:hypothetical protein
MSYLENIGTVVVAAMASLYRYQVDYRYHNSAQQNVLYSCIDLRTTARTTEFFATRSSWQQRRLSSAGIFQIQKFMGL